MRFLDPERKFISAVLSRNYCTRILDTYIKDLRLLLQKNRRMEQMVIVDNSVLAFAFQPENGVYIPPYDGNGQDDHLRRVASFLFKVRDVADVRPFVSRFSGIVKRL